MHVALVSLRACADCSVPDRPDARGWALLEANALAVGAPPRAAKPLRRAASLRGLAYRDNRAGCAARDDKCRRRGGGGDGGRDRGVADGAGGDGSGLGRRLQVAQGVCG